MKFWLLLYRWHILGGAVLLAVGFGAGLLLRGPISGGLDWCRDVDYGNFPQWVAIAVGIIFGSITARGVWIASASYRHSRESYEEDVRLREYAQARLIYVETVWSRKFQAGTTVNTVKGVEDLRASFTYLSSSLKPWFVVKWLGAVGGQKSLSIKTDGRAEANIFQLRVHNNSDEVISDVLLTVRERVGGTISGALLPSRVIVHPHQTADLMLVMGETGVEKYDATVAFTDSSGVAWLRVGAKPVQRLD